MTNLFLTTLAYRYVMLLLVNGEADLAVSRLDSNKYKPFAFEELKVAHIARPSSFQGGTIETDGQGFIHSDASRQIYSIDGKTPVDYTARGRIWEQMPSLVDKDGAAALAKRWLSAFEVNVTNLSSAYPMEVTQMTLIDGPTTRLLPWFIVAWPDARRRSVVSVSVFGPTMTPLSIRQDNSKFSNRPKYLIRDPGKLLVIPDETFLQMPDTERHKLVLTHANTNYPNLRFPPSGWFDRRFGPREATPPAALKRPTTVITVPPK